MISKLDKSLARLIQPFAEEHQRALCTNHFFAFSLLVASSSSPLSTSAAGRCTYRTTLPRINTFLTELRCGYFPSSMTVISSSLMLRYWSTDLSVPRIEISFLSSTVMVEFVRVLKKLGRISLSRLICSRLSRVERL